MIKFKYTALAFIAILLLNGCNSDDDNDNIHELSQKNVYEGYAESSNGDPLFLSVYMPNDDTLLMKKLDKNNNQTTAQGSLTDSSTILFDNFTCIQSTSSLTCNDFELPIKDLPEVRLDTLAGTYSAVDDTNIKRELIVNDDGAFTITNISNIDCTISGNISLELNNTLPFITLNANNCSSNGDFRGVATVEKLYNENDTLDIIVDDFVNLTDYWVK